MTRTRIAVVAAVVVASLAPAMGTQAREGSRSGRILGGAAWSRAAFGHETRTVSDFGECQRTADCAAFVRSGCNPGLAGQDPAVLTSIVDVADLADGRTRRFVADTTARPAGWNWGVLVLQFWSQDCTEIRAARWNAYDNPGWNELYGSDKYPIVPRSAKWMTVTATNDMANISWRLG